MQSYKVKYFDSLLTYGIQVLLLIRHEKDYKL
jgi:hypothetical protein